MVIYFILADDTGAPTTADGTAKLTISDWSPDDGFTSERWTVPLLSISLDIKKTDFQKQEVGKGDYKRKVILCSLGRIPYSKFSRRPYRRNGFVILEFQSMDGKLFKAREEIHFN